MTDEEMLAQMQDVLDEMQDVRQMSPDRRNEVIGLYIITWMRFVQAWKHDLVVD